MFIKKIKLKNFRCFKNEEFSFDNKLVVIEGQNGSGKTSLLEAIYYACYLRSFRTRLSRELVAFNDNHFFLEVDFDDSCELQNQIQAGYSGKEGKVVKFNQKQVSSYKDIISSYKIIGATEEDLQLIGKGPEERRSFLNQSLFLIDPDVSAIFRKYKQVLDQRNAILARNSNRQLDTNLKQELYSWTKQLWNHSSSLQSLRIEFLNKVENIVNTLLCDYFKDLAGIKIKLKYQPRNLSISDSFKKFWDWYQKNLLEKELRWARSMFGMHLDDFAISFKEKRARFFASRGQQKLILFLLKIAQLQMLQKAGEIPCFLLDDFLTDFDASRLDGFLNLFKNLECQIFLTSPLQSFLGYNGSKQFDFQTLKL